MLTDELPGEMSGGAFFESEPESGPLLAQLMPLVFKEAVFDIMINSQASEQGARMTSMDNATRNAGDMISRLTLRYNRMRRRRSPPNWWKLLPAPRQFRAGLRSV